jgi:DNA-binding transcriptional ArsR family regulator
MNMARTATTFDVFNAVAEAQRRAILVMLAQDGERSVNSIAKAMNVRQPQASKHLNVLKQVGLVTARVARQQRLYRLNAEALKPIYEWVSPFERIWNARLDRLSTYLDALQQDADKGES